jgi:osmotically-inducible protein OsmY
MRICRLKAAALCALLATTTLSGCFPLIAGGMLTTALVATDRRTSGIVVEDNASEFRIGNRISTRFGNDAHVNVHSFNRIVLLTGEVRNEEVRKGVEEIARSAENVRTVINETAAMSSSSISERAGDSLLADKIRARYLSEGHFQATVVATIVERHEVFLMGMVTPAEADEATRVASTTSGVERVVKVFEYLDPARLPPQPARQDSALPSDAQK